MGVRNEDDESDVVASVAKGAIFALGTIAAIGIGLAIVKSVFPVLLVAGAGYLGYRMVRKNKALPASAAPKALSSGDDFDRRMAELDAIEKKLDAEIRKNS